MSAPASPSRSPEAEPAGAPQRNWAVAALLEAGWAPVGVLFLHFVATRVFHVYRIFPPADIPMHFLGGIAIAFFFRTAFGLAARAGLLGTVNHLGLAFMTFGMTCAAAVFWEFAEFLSDHWLGTRAQVSNTDTLKDMAVGIAGGVTFILIARRRHARGRSQAQPGTPRDAGLSSGRPVR